MNDIVQIETELVAALKMLPKAGLVTGTSGNISARVGSDWISIKPSGVPYEDLDRHGLVTVSVSSGKLVSAGKPSTDLASHLHIYRARDGVKAIVHTHSPYATAFAAQGLPILCILTAIADEFGGHIPCSNYAAIGGEEIGAEVIRLLNERYCPAILLRSHGVFTVGPSIQAALKAAIMVEDVARTVLFAKTLTGYFPSALPPDVIEACQLRYSTEYGQQPSRERF